MAPELTREFFKKTFDDFQAYRRAGKIVVDYVLLSSIVMHFRANKDPKKNRRHELQEYYLQNLVAPLNRWMPIYGIDTAIRAAHFLSQACCETFQFSAVTETPRNGGKEYDGRRDLGNTQLGDGPRYIGRGLLHLTGRENYRVMGNKIGMNLVDNPNSVSDDLDIAVRTACEYWRNRGINEIADRDDFDSVTKKINGGHNGRDERYAALQRVKEKLGIV